MAPRKSFPLRISQDVFDKIRQWAEEDLRSVNAQIEYLLAQALRARGRRRSHGGEGGNDGEGGDDGEDGNGGDGPGSECETDPEGHAAGEP